VNNFIAVLIEIPLNLKMASSNFSIFKILILLIHENGKSFYHQPFSKSFYPFIFFYAGL
jgi:hypothetical protein